MSAPLPRNILKIPGKLIKSPTNLSTTSPYGGTELGVCRDMAFDFGQTTDEPVAEEFKAAVAVILQSERPVFGCVLRSWDNDMVSSIWHNTQTSTHGEVGILAKVSGSGVKRAGTNLGTRGFKLLFDAHASDRHPSILLYNAIPLPAESAELQLSIGKEMGIALMFRAIPDSSARVYVVDQRGNMSL